MAKRLAVVVTALWFVVSAAPALAQSTSEPGSEPESDPVAEPPASEEPVQPPDQAAEASASLITPKISGFVDLTYNYNTRDPMDGVSAFHSYTAKHDTVLLNAAHVALNGSNDSVSYAVEVDVGSDAAVTSGEALEGAPDDVDLQEAYVSYVSPIRLGIKVGKFVTYEGIEVIESGANPTISRGFLFGLAEPFSHAGAVLTYKVNDQFDIAAGVVNGWDVVVDNNQGKTFVAKLGFVSDAALVTVSGYAGPEQEGDTDNLRLSGDVTGMVKAGPVDLWFQANGGSEEGTAAEGAETGTWYGAGLQPLWRASEKLVVGARGEIFRDADGARTAIEQTLYNVTVTPAYTLTTGLVIRGEIRFDMSSENVFMDNDGQMHDSQVLGLTEAIYSF